jgi:hypothetical protein
MKYPFRRLLLLLAALGFTTAVQSAPIPDAEARFLAGLPVRDTPIEPLSRSPGWAAHAVELDRAWAELDKHQLQPIQAWAPGALGHFHTDTGPVLYFFSGPDFLYAHAFFPNASTYVLCGIEPIGPLPSVEDLPPETLAASLATLRDSMDTLLDFSFFITKKMRVQLHDSRLSGTLPLLYVFLARSGCHIRNVTFIGLDAKGQLTTAPRTLAPGVEIVFTGPNGQDQSLYYFSTDLSDGPADRSGFLKWCAGLGPATGFLKAASYLMHTDGFDSTRQFLLTDCAAILQDDSGIPMRYFPAHDWDIRLFGDYRGPIATFKQFPQPELDELKAVQKPADLPFSVGYRWHPGESSLIFAVKAGHTAALGSPTPRPETMATESR